jgi:hypothetical protein
MRHVIALGLSILSACAGTPSAPEDGADGGLSNEGLVCTPRIEREIPELFRRTNYVPASTVEGSITVAGRTWQIASAVLAMAHVRDPDATDRCVVEYSVVAFLDRDVETCMLALRFVNYDGTRRLDQFAVDTTGCAGVPSADELTWISDTGVASRWPTLEGNLLADDDVELCNQATVSFPDVVLPLPLHGMTSVSLDGFRIAGPLGSSAADWSAACDAPVTAECSTGELGSDGVCPLP